MSKNRDCFIGARFTLEEKDYILKIAKKRKINVSELIRESIFSHLNFLENHNVKRIEMFLIEPNPNNIERKVKR